jgi:hypothetical protein
MEYKIIKEQDFKTLLAKGEQFFVELGGDIKTAAQLLAEAKHHGLEVRPDLLKALILGYIGGLLFYTTIGSKVFYTRVDRLHDGHLENDYGLTVRYKIKVESVKKFTWR